nr:hypothetical protein BaRGS_016203 [Batillaria attramentaria]
MGLLFRLVTVDITNTMIRVMGSPGRHYALVAARHGIEADEEALTFSFLKHYKDYCGRFPNFGASVDMASIQVLLYAMGLDATKVYKTFKFPVRAEGAANDPQDDYNIVIGLFDAYFVPKKNIFHERTQFYPRSQHNDTLTSAMKAVFPDSAIARGLKCGRSKATAMIKEMAAQAASGLQERMRCLQRLLENWDALKVFFNEEAESLKKKAASSPYAVSKVSIIYDFVRSPTNKLYLHFLLYSVAAFQEFLLVFQSEAPHIHKLKRGMEKLLNTILSHFVKPAARRGKSVLDNEFAKTDNIVSNADLGIGEEARNFIEDKGANHLRDSRISEFYTNHAEVADVSLQDSASQQSVRYFLKRFPCLLPPGADVNIILDQFAQYQGEGVMDQVAKREDQTWLNISKMPDKDYKALSLVMRGILTIPLGSVHCERVFSCVRKLKRPERSCLSEETLESILVLQSSSVGPVEAVNPMSDQQLDAIKLAYALSLKKKCLSLD